MSVPFCGAAGQCEATSLKVAVWAGLLRRRVTRAGKRIRFDFRNLVCWALDASTGRSAASVPDRIASLGYEFTVTLSLKWR